MRRISIKDITFMMIFTAFGLWLLLLALPPLDAALGAGGTQTLNTTLNITNAAPEVRTVLAPSSINLEAYGNVSVECNVTVFDWDNDTLSVNATFYLNGTADADTADDYNYHYTNTSCILKTAQDREMNYTCGFDVIYFATNSTEWICNVTVIDDDEAVHDNVSSRSTVNPLVAIYVPSVLDFGRVAYENISEEVLANITNAGNRPVNISVKGWGVEEDDGLAMNCTYGNISQSYQRYGISPGIVWDSADQLPNSDTLISDYYIQERTSQTEDSYDVTYWKIKVPEIAGGICTGKILFTASDYGN